MKHVRSVSVAGSRINLRRVFERTQLKLRPVVIEDDWSSDDALSVLVGGDGTVGRIRAELVRRPQLADAPLAELLRELAAVPGVGRAASLRFVAAEFYRGS